MAETSGLGLEAGDLPVVSVIIPTFGRPDKVSRAIDSVLAQTYARIEVVVVDDNPLSSEDQVVTKLALRSYIDCQQIRYITRESNGGGSAARNTGLEAACGSLVTFLDDDDVYMPEKVEKQVRHMSAYDLDISLCHMLLSDNGTIVKSPLSFARGTSLPDFILDGNTFTPMIMVRREVLTEAGGFPETPRFQDHLLMIKLLENGARAGILDEHLFVHDDHSGNRISMSKRSLEGYRNKHAFELKNVSSLNRPQRRSVLFRHATVGMKIARAEDGLFAGLGLLPAAISNVGKPNDLVTIARTICNIVLKPNKKF